MKQDLTASSFYKLKLHKNKLFDIYKSEPKEESEFDLITRNCMVITKHDNIYDDLPSSQYNDYCLSTDDEGTYRTLTYLSHSKETLTSRLNSQEVCLHSNKLNNPAPIRLKLKEIPNNLMANLVNPINPQFKMAQPVKSLIKTRKLLKFYSKNKEANQEKEDNSLLKNIFINKHKSSNGVTIEEEPKVVINRKVNRASKDAYYNNEIKMNTISHDAFEFENINKLKFFSVERKKKDIVDTYNKHLALLNKKEEQKILLHSKLFFYKAGNKKGNKINTNSNNKKLIIPTNTKPVLSSIDKPLPYTYFNSSNKKYLITKA